MSTAAPTAPRTLADVRPGRAPLRVTEVTAPAGMRRRLAELGVRPGARIRVRHDTHGRGRVVAVSGTRVALSRGALGYVAVAEL